MVLFLCFLTLISFLLSKKIRLSFLFFHWLLQSANFLIAQVLFLLHASKSRKRFKSHLMLPVPSLDIYVLVHLFDYCLHENGWDWWLTISSYTCIGKKFLQICISKNPQTTTACCISGVKLQLSLSLCSVVKSSSIPSFIITVSLCCCRLSLTSNLLVFFFFVDMTVSK